MSSPEEVDQARKVVQVVEDDRFCRVMIADAVTRWGYRSVGAADGAAAIDQLACERFDLTLLDARMPKMDGE